MEQTQQGLLKTSLRFVNKAMNENALLRISVLATVLLITLACIALAAFGSTYAIGPKDAPKAYSPRLFALLFLPAEFLIYDLILGNREPRATLKDLYLDWRLPRFFWEILKVLVAVVLPAIVVILLVARVAGVAGLFKNFSPSNAALVILLLAVGFLALFLVMLSVMFRFLYLPIVVARRQAQALTTAWRETKGKVWQISCALFLPYLAVIAVSVPTELLGPVLERNLGFVGLAPWFLFDALLTGYMCCVTAAVFAFSYQRIIMPEPEAEAAPQFNLTPPPAP